MRTDELLKACWPFLLVGLALSCAPRPGAREFISIHVTWEPGVTARCFVVRATGDGQPPRTTLPMIRGPDDALLKVAVFRDDAPAEVTLEALGFSDEGCITPTGEQSVPQRAAFGSRLAEAPLELRVREVPIVAGTDLDGDGSPTPDDCDDGNPLVRPGLGEACGDTFDNDCDDVVDCEDSDCLARSCGLGLACLATRCGEAACSNGVDDDGDGLLDCADGDCDLQPCGTGGTCRGGRCRAATEARCDDGDDNDGNGLTDCDDPQCSARECSDGDGCTLGETCQGTSCTGGAARDCGLGLPACLLNLGCDAGLCLAGPAASGASCNGPCTPGGVCDGDGGCSVSPSTCPPPPGPCFGAGTCQAVLDGGCSYPVVTTNSCDDADGCTTLDACQADGGCAGSRLGCTPPSECLAWANTCTGGACDFVPRTGQACDAGTCSGAGQCLAGGTRWPYVPANFDPALISPDDGGIAIDCLEVVLDTEPTPATLMATGCSAAAVLPGVGAVVQLQGGEAVLLPASSLFVDAGARFVVVGTRPVIFAVNGDVTIAGQLLAVARGPRPAAGADAAGRCAGASGTSGTAGTESGPGASGGAFGSAGGAGGPGSGNAGSAPPATTPVGSPTLVPLQGGCSGGAGAGSGGGALGRAGGGVQISSTGSLVVSGLIAAPGEGGRGASGGFFGGGGAGSGGGVLLEAPMFRLSATGRVLALGGGGGEGSATLDGNDGAVGSRTDGVAAPGGFGGSPRGGSGGAGASQTLAARDGSAGTLQGAGGGGGAGVGRVRFNFTASCTFVSGALVSPQASSADGGCR